MYNTFTPYNPVPSLKDLNLKLTLLEDEYLNMVDISVNVEQSFLLSNGLISHNSAVSSFRKYRNNEIQGAFALRGKFINASEATTAGLNMRIIGLVKRPDNAYGEHAKWLVQLMDHSFRAGVAGV